MTVVTATRIKFNDQSSVALWQHPKLTATLCCLEPGQKREPHPGIPEGEYVLKLRKVGEKHKAYKKYYDAMPAFGPNWHQGMIEITGVKDREAIEFHVGNHIADSLGCSLAGLTYAMGPDHNLFVSFSRHAYEMAYPVLRDLILAGPVTLKISNAEAMV